MIIQILQHGIQKKLSWFVKIIIIINYCTIKLNSVYVTQRKQLYSVLYTIVEYNFLSVPTEHNEYKVKQSNSVLKTQKDMNIRKKI